MSAVPAKCVCCGARLEDWERHRWYAMTVNRDGSRWAWCEFCSLYSDGHLPVELWRERTGIRG